MSKQKHNEHEPGLTQRTFSVIGIIGFLLLFAIIIGIVYLPKRPGPADAEIVADRKAKLAEVEAQQQELISSYAWVDQTEGVIRIPVEQSMKLVVTELQREEESELQKEEER